MLGPALRPGALDGSDASRDTWEPLDNITNLDYVIAAFELA